MPRLVLHVGTHKTGSTAIQQLGSKQAQALADRGVLITRRPDVALEIELAQHVRADLSRALGTWIRALADRLTAGAPQVGTLVVSHEGFSGDGDRGYANAPAVARMVADAVEGVDARVVLFLRRQDAFLASMYAQTVKIGGTAPIDDYLADLLPSGFRWSELLGAYVDAFGRDAVDVVVYEADHDPDWSAVTALLHHLGVDLPEASTTRANPGLDGAAVEVMRRANERLAPDNTRVLRRVLEAVAPAPAVALFDDESRHFLCKVFREDWHTLAGMGVILPAWFVDPDGVTLPDGPELTEDDVMLRALTQMTTLAGEALRRANLTTE